MVPEPALVDLGEVRPAEEAGALVEITNPCGGALEVASIDLTRSDLGPSAFVVEGPPALPVVVDAASAVMLDVQFEPGRFGPYEEQLVIRSAHPSIPVEVVVLRAVAVCESLTADVDGDLDGVPDACDACLEGPDDADADEDGTPDDCDRCADGDDRLDTDQDTIPDACDVCPGGDDRIDDDADGVPDDCEL
ncbi:MAG: hypothetical protein AAF211_22885 [Myxococcota bacterium]